MRFKYKWALLVMMMTATAVCSVPVFAATCGGVETSLISCDDSEGGVWHILNLILDIFSIGVGILGVVGITVVGVQYLNAKDNEEQVRKARTRLFQIVIGLAVYAVLFVFLEWLLPGGIASSQSELTKTGSTTQIQELEKQREETKKQVEAARASGSVSGSSTSLASDSSSEAKTSEEIRKELAKVAKIYALEKYRSEYQKAVKEMGIGKTNGDGTDSCFKAGRACSAYVATVIRKVIPSARGKNGWPAMSHKVLNNYLPKHSKEWKKISASQAQPGDVAVKNGHIAMVIQGANGPVIAEADYSACQNGGSGGWPHVSSSSPVSRTSMTYYRYIGGE